MGQPLKQDSSCTDSPNKHACLTSVLPQQSHGGGSSARPHLIYWEGGREGVTQNCDHANAPAWKIQKPNDKPWCAGADRGRKRGTTWHSMENLWKRGLCRLPQVSEDVVWINVRLALMLREERTWELREMTINTKASQVPGFKGTLIVQMPVGML